MAQRFMLVGIESKVEHLLTFYSNARQNRFLTQAVKGKQERHGPRVRPMNQGLRASVPSRVLGLLLER